MSTSVYYRGLCVLPRRMFSLSVSMDLAELAFICGNVCSEDGREKSGCIKFFPSLHTRTLRPLLVVFYIKSSWDGDKQPRRSTGAARNFRGSGATGARSCPQSRMSPTALSPLKIALGLSMGTQAVLQVELMGWLFLGSGRGSVMVCYAQGRDSLDLLVPLGFSHWF